MFTEPCTSANQITYLFFCTGGGLANPRFRKRMHCNGTDVFFSYHYLRY